MRDGGHFFGVFQDHADRFVGFLSEKIADRRLGDRSLAAEIAADRKDMNFDFRFVETEIAGKPSAQCEWRFVRRPDFNAAVVMNLDGALVRLDVTVES